MLQKESWAYITDNTNVKWVKIFQLFEKKINNIKGNILDIGAGTGYASIWLALNSKVDSIISVETSEVCVKIIIPNFSKK